MNDEKRNKRPFEDKQNQRPKRPAQGDDFIKESYQPTEDKLDDKKPPGGGSGVPDKEDD